MNLLQPLIMIMKGMEVLINHSILMNGLRIMSVLSGKEVIKLVKKGVIKITPFNEELVGACSVDFTLDNEFRVFKKNYKKTITSESDYKEFTKVVRVKELELRPGELVHGVTRESIKLPNNICGWIQGRSSLARKGLLVHLTASLIHAGSEGKQVLEIANLSPYKIKLKPGIRICQIIFEKVKGEASYEGRYKKQAGP